MTSLTLVVVCHMRDIGMLRLQARSIALYAPRSLVACILVVENDSDGEAFAETFTERVFPEYGDLKDLVKLVRRDCLAPGIGFAHGWRSQQILKLLSARLTQSDFMLILDAKNHFIRPINERSYISADGKPRTCTTSRRGHLEHVFRNSFAAWGLDPERFIDSALPNVTPFAVRTSSVAAMIDLIEVKQKNEFSAFFLQHDIAEFYLFSAFIAWRDGVFTREYALGDAGMITLFAGQTNPKGFEWVDMRIQQEATLCFAVHWEAIGLLSHEQKHAISALWVERRLVGDIAEGLSFLAEGDVSVHLGSA